MLIVDSSTPFLGWYQDPHPYYRPYFLVDDLELGDEKMFVFTPACVSVFFTHLAIVFL